MMYSAKNIAEYVVDYCNRQGNPVSNLKLQKILYFLWVDYYKQTKTELFPEKFAAWQFGPVVPDIYYEFCEYGGLPITENFAVQLDDHDHNLINSIIEHYLPKTARELVSMTHQENTPWYTVYKNGEGARHPIPTELIIKKLEA